MNRGRCCCADFLSGDDSDSLESHTICRTIEALQKEGTGWLQDGHAVCATSQISATSPVPISTQIFRDQISP